MVGLERTPRFWGFVMLAGLPVLGGAACAAGSESPPTGAAASGEPATGSGGSDAASTSSAGANGAGSTATSTVSASSSASQSSGGEGGQGGDGGASGGAGPGTGGTGPGVGGAGGDGGAGGAGSGGAGGDAGSGGSGGEAPTTGVVAFFAVKASGAFGAVRDEDGVYTTETFGGTYAASTRPALAMRSSAAAVGLARSSSDALLYVRHTGSAWIDPATVAAAITTIGAPSIASDLGGDAHATYLGDDGKHYYAFFDGSGFDPDDDPVGGTGPSQAFGPSAASVAVVGGDALVAQAGDDDDVYVIEQAGSGWNAAVEIPVAATNVDLTPAIAAIDPSSGGDALIVFTGADTKLYWSIRDGGTWTAPAEIDDALSTDAPSLAATPDGAVVAFRGTNGGVYAALFDGNGWEAPELVVPITTQTDSAPAVASGAGDADAEIAFIDDDGGAVVHVRLANGSFGAPTTVGGTDLTGVAIAAAP